MTSTTTGEGLAGVLTSVWEEQGRIGFLLSDPDEAQVEVRIDRDPVSGVPFRFRWMPHRELRTNVAILEERGILNPDRDESSLFHDPRDPSGRFCFLCPDNIRECNPREQLVPLRLDGRHYMAGANFAWISRDHFTVMSVEHVDQDFTEHSLAAMLDLHGQTGGHFRVIYNGAYAGATIPWHLHYQITSEPFPVEDLPPGREQDYPTALQRFTVEDRKQALTHVAEWVEAEPEHHRVNVLVAGPASDPVIHVFARDTRRSHAAAKGLMGGFEVCGDLVYSEPDKRQVFESASSELARSLLAEIRPAGV